MTWLAKLLAPLAADNDALAPYRARIATHLSLLAVVVLLPFTLNHAVQGRWWLALAIGAAQAVMALNSARLQRGLSAPVPFELMVLVLIGAVCASAHQQALHALYWAYPTLFIAYFLLPRRTALLQSLLLTLAATALCVMSLGWPVSLRVGATLSLTLVMINVVLNVIGELQQALVRQANTDPLTGAFNRRHLHEQLALVGDGAAVTGEAPSWALLAIDIDHFKRINDTFGHATGDEVLRRTVQVVSRRKRKSDLLFRTGGEEFVLLLPGANAADAQRVADDIRQQIEQSQLLPEGDWPVTVSIGLTLHRAGQAADTAMRAADAALYDAKRRGRNRVVLAGA